MYRHVSAYDFFAILVPGAVALGVPWLLANLVLPLSLAGTVGKVVLVFYVFIAAYLVGHFFENIHESRLRLPKQWRNIAREVWDGPRGKPEKVSNTLLGPSSKLGTQFVQRLYDVVNAKFGLALNPAEEKDRYQVFMLCSAYMQQAGEAERGMVMQTLHRLCRSLQSLFRLAALVTMLMFAGLVAFLLLDHWGAVAPQDVPPLVISPFDALTSALLAGIFAAFSARCAEKARGYDEHFVSNVVRFRTVSASDWRRA